MNLFMIEKKKIRKKLNEGFFFYINFFYLLVVYIKIIINNIRNLY